MNDGTSFLCKRTFCVHIHLNKQCGSITNLNHFFFSFSSSFVFFAFYDNNKNKRDSFFPIFFGVFFLAIHCGRWFPVRFQNFWVGTDKEKKYYIFLLSRYYNVIECRRYRRTFRWTIEIFEAGEREREKNCAVLNRSKHGGRKNSEVFFFSWIPLQQT